MNGGCTQDQSRSTLQVVTQNLRLSAFIIAFQSCGILGHNVESMALVRENPRSTQHGDGVYGPDAVHSQRASMS